VFSQSKNSNGQNGESLPSIKVQTFFSRRYLDILIEPKRKRKMEISFTAGWLKRKDHTIKHLPQFITKESRKSEHEYS
jgi:hypothetical protein